MNNFLMIDSNKIATKKQVYMVACHFANIQSEAPSERYGLTKVFNAILNSFYRGQDSFMTHGEVQDFREHQVVPAQFIELIQKPKAKAKPKAKIKPKAKAKTVAKAQTVQQAEIALDVKKPKAAPKKATPVNSVAKKMDGRITALETKVSEVDSKLDAILAILSK